MQLSIVTSALLALCVKAATAASHAYTGPAISYTPSGIIGTCGVAIQNSDFSVALDNTQFVHGRFCGRKVKVFYGGKSAIVTVADKCPTCVGGIGLTPAAFEYFAPLKSGWFKATWEFV
ncbi:expansin family protein [Laccaria bicolor S238N-H82]|uniref:Expansin family protein n=1 Tax=Laccaria bicolor (strain S238N-H82 / ATCC MYA-4686) TaxID=486041 RepID=B0DPC1_LACBS|nr:expansin family protein [Laccaria bicolor S238N-H82]EDR03593.1 expansin family protein [Laccaria bicolor S238N-H82]|eukprot:XP_001885741.1 expansin family protein [Laccaria bicolor S238N-H82]